MYVCVGGWGGAGGNMAPKKQVFRTCNWKKKPPQKLGYFCAYTDRRLEQPNEAVLSTCLVVLRSSG